MDTPEPPPPPAGLLSWLTAVKSLTITNVLVIGMLVVIAIPAYLVYRALNDEKLLDRFLSHYEEITSQQVGCALRTANTRGGPDLWNISTGFAFQGADRWSVGVILNHKPSESEIVSYCETLKLISDKMLLPPS